MSKEEWEVNGGEVRMSKYAWMSKWDLGVVSMQKGR